MAFIGREQCLLTANRLLSHVAKIGSANPTIWRRVDEVRAACSGGSASRPSWCFLPSGALRTLAREFPAIAQRSFLFEALAAWRPGQGMYMFDALLAAELSRTAADEPIRGDTLLHMPEWCIYIAATEGPLARWGLNGAFAFLSYDEANKEAVLRFLLDMDDDRLLATLPVRLGNGSVQESVVRAASEAARTLAIAGKTREFDELCSIDVRQYGEALAHLVNLVLYVCSTNADIVGFDNAQYAPSRPMPTKTRRGLRMFSPDKVAMWEVGFRVGTALRRGREQMDEAASERSEVRPHLRRAHWHAFWMGSRSEPDSRVLRVRWLPPILVGADSADNVSAVRVIQPNRKSD